MLSRRRIAKIMQRATRAFGDVQERMDYTRPGAPVFDPISGRTTTPALQSFARVPVLPTVIDEKELGPKTPVDIKTDLKLIVAYLDLPLVPVVEDRLFFRNASWNVIHVGEPPADAVHILYVRKA